MQGNKGGISPVDAVPFPQCCRRDASAFEVQMHLQSLGLLLSQYLRIGNDDIVRFGFRGSSFKQVGHGYFNSQYYLYYKQFIPILVITTGQSGGLVVPFRSRRGRISIFQYINEPEEGRILHGC